MTIFSLQKITYVFRVDCVQQFLCFFRGLVPISYINIIVDMMNVQHETAVTVHENLLPDTFHKVLYTFHGQMEGDLSVAEGEVVRVCEKQNEDW